MGKVYVMGDTHGDWRKMYYLCKNMNDDDIVIHVGDHGINYYGNSGDNNLKEKISKMKPTFIFISGNHDRPPEENCIIYKKNDIIKGDFLFEEEYPKILHCPKINIFYINDTKFLTIGGAYSIDKEYRLRNKWNWFENEQISEEEMNTFKQNYKGYNTDFIISHTSPEKYEPTHLFLPFIDQSKVDKRTENFLEWVETNITYKEWFLGHYHSNEQLWDKGYMLFENVKEIINF